MTNDNTEQCKPYMVTLSEKRVMIYVPCHYNESAVNDFMDNTFGVEGWHNYKEL